MNTIRFSLVFLFLFSFTVHSLSALERRPVEPGKKAPDFTLKDANGKSHTLSDYEGKIIVLEWLNHECPFVVKHYASGNMQKLQETFKDKGVVWFSIISSAPGEQGYLTPEQAKSVTREKKAKPRAVLLDPEGKVGRAYQARVTPHMYIIDSSGFLSYIGAIDDKPSTNVEDVETARNYVSEALDLLLDGRSVNTTTTQPYGCTVKY
ncbi:thioredoxin family protein [Balneolaceae bacterium ANBcel3]|nr:thioredoxin family protein [Balneolaceae bacterium ANBcel3]